MKKWNVFAQTSNREEVIPLILKSRGLSSAEELEKFLNPPKISDEIQNIPLEFKQSLVSAAKIIKEHMALNLPIVIHGDYDADGVTATAILYKTLKNELNYEKTYYFIPNRFEHGYGLSQKSVDEVLARVKPVVGPVLFITVDSGITANESVDYINSLGHKVIITDHHQKSSELPKAAAIVWYDKVVGAGVSWILSRVLGAKDSQTVSLAALATITDLQPVLGLNRSILKRGLEVFNSTPNLGLKKLLQVSGKSVGDITSYDFGWVIGPRLNASGRLVEAEDSLLLLLSENENEAEVIANKLHSVNNTRQDKTLEMFELAADVDPQNLPPVIISTNKDYHEGIIGLVAAKLAQKYYRPAIVISLNEEHGKGSVRSIPGIDIISALRNFEDMFDSLGGHPMAAGFTIKHDRISALENKLVEYLKTTTTADVFERKQKVDLEIPAEFIDIDLVEDLAKLEPYGLGNEEPIFGTKAFGVVDVTKVGRDGKHVSLKLYKDGRNYKAIYFNAADGFPDLNMGDKVDIAYTLNKNCFNGRISVDLVVKDLRCI